MSKRYDLDEVAESLRLGKGGPLIRKAANGAVEFADAGGAVVDPPGSVRSVHASAFDNSEFSEGTTLDTEIVSLDTTSLQAPFMVYWSVETRAGADPGGSGGYPETKTWADGVNVSRAYGSVWTTIWFAQAGIYVATAPLALYQMTIRSSRVDAYVLGRRARLLAMEIRT